MNLNCKAVTDIYFYFNLNLHLSNNLGLRTAQETLLYSSVTEEYRNALHKLMGTCVTSQCGESPSAAIPPGSRAILPCHKPRVGLCGTRLL